MKELRYVRCQCGYTQVLEGEKVLISLEQGTMWVPPEELSRATWTFLDVAECNLCPPCCGPGEACSRENCTGTPLSECNHDEGVICVRCSSELMDFVNKDWRGAADHQPVCCDNTSKACSVNGPCHYWTERASDGNSFGDVNIESSFQVSAQVRLICKEDKQVMFHRVNDEVRMYIERPDEDGDYEIKMACLFPIHSLQTVLELLTS